MLTASAGTLTGQTTSFAAPAASTTSCGGSAIGTRASSAPPTPGRVGRALQRRPHLHLARRRVAQGQHGAELVAVAHQRRQAGEHLQVLRDADAGAAGAELLHLGVGDGDEPEAGERVVDRHRDRRLAVGVDDDVRLPDQQGVEQLARRAAAAAAAGRRPPSCRSGAGR